MLNHRSIPTTLDGLYDDFVSQLPSRLQEAARDLPRRLGLTCQANMPWSAVFNNPAVLGFPLLLLGDTDRSTTSAIMRASARAHLLAVIGAFGADRIDDGQIAPDSLVAEVLEALYEARDRTIEALGDGLDCSMDYTWATDQTRRSVIEEQRALLGDRDITWSKYLEVSLLKQGLAFPASMVAAEASQWSDEDRRRVYDVVAGAALGLQYRDDVVDWQEDQARDASWAVALGAETDAGSVEMLEQALDRSQTLVTMLEMSRDEFQRASEAAGALGATGLAGWAAEQARVTEDLARREAQTPGTAVRWELDRRARRAARQQAMMTDTMRRSA